jgi:hypothetical protein
MKCELDFERCWKWAEESSTCDIVNISSSLDTADQFGTVQDGTLIIRGRAMEVKITLHNDDLLLEGSRSSERLRMG